jgi:hypothetical protein
VNWWVVLTALGWLAFFALTLAMPILHEERLATLAMVLSVALGLTLLLVIIMAAERPRWSLRTRILMAVIGVGFVVLAYFLQLKGPEWRGLIALALMGLAVPVGYWIGERMEKITNLIPLAIAMSLADIFSVFQGPTKKIAEDLTVYHERVQAANAAAVASGSQVVEQFRAPLADFIVVHFPLAGQQGTSPVLGIGDFIVLAFMFRAAWVHHVSPRLMLGSALLSIFIALVYTNTLNMPLPALPFIALGMMSVLWLSQPRMRRLDRQEVVLSLVVVAIFGALITGKWVKGMLGM